MRGERIFQAEETKILRWQETWHIQGRPGRWWGRKQEEEWLQWWEVDQRPDHAARMGHTEDFGIHSKSKGMLSRAWRHRCEDHIGSRVEEGLEGGTVNVWGQIRKLFFHRPCVIGQWIALQWIIQTLNKYQRCAGSITRSESQSLGLRRVDFHLYISVH